MLSVDTEAWKKRASNKISVGQVQNKQKGICLHPMGKSAKGILALHVRSLQG